VVVGTNKRSETWSTAYAGIKRLARGVTEDDLQDAALASLEHDAEVVHKRGWLRAVARNRWKMRTRRAAVWERIRSRLAVQSPPVGDPLEHLELARALEHALDDLQPAVADAVRMRFFLELSTREIAQRQGCPPGTAKWRVHEGLRRLRSNLDERGGGRRAWLPALLAFARTPDPPPVVPSLLSKGPLMLTATTLTTAIAILTAQGLSASPNAQTPSEPTVATSAVAKPHPHPAPNVLTRASAAEPRTESKRAGSSTAGEDEGEVCGDEAMRAFNTEPDHPDAEEHLLDAAECYGDAGLLGRAHKLYQVIEMQHPEGRYLELSRTRRQAILVQLLDPESPAKTPFGRTCLAPLRKAKPDTLAQEQAAAAECLMGGSYAAAAAELRKRAATALTGAAKDDNAKALEKVERVLLGIRRLQARDAAKTGT